MAPDYLYLALLAYGAFWIINASLFSPDDRKLSGIDRLFFPYHEPKPYFVSSQNVALISMGAPLLAAWLLTLADFQIFTALLIVSLIGLGIDAALILLLVWQGKLRFRLRGNPFDD